MTERTVLNLAGSDDPTQAFVRRHPLPKGWYKGVIYEAEDKFAKNKKTGKADPSKPFIRTVFRVTEEGDNFKRTVFDNFVGKYITEKAPWLAAKAEQLARISGVWDGEDRAAVILPFAEDVEGLEVEAYVKVVLDEYAMEEYEKENGEEPEEPIYRNEIAAYRPIGGWPKPGDAKSGAKKGGAKRNTAITL